MRYNIDAKGPPKLRTKLVTMMKTYEVNVINSRKDDLSRKLVSYGAAILWYFLVGGFSS